MLKTKLQGLKAGFSMYNFANTTDRILRQNIYLAVREVMEKKIPNKSISLYVKIDVHNVRQYDITHMVADGKHIIFDVDNVDTDIVDLLKNSGFKVNYSSKANSQDLTILSIQLDRNGI